VHVQRYYFLPFAAFFPFVCDPPLSKSIFSKFINFFIPETSEQAKHNDWYRHRLWYRYHMIAAIM
jgi:hypothetical protein